MNKQLQIFARRTLKEGLAKCTPDEHHIFRRMYSFKDLKKPIDEVVDGMDPDKLDWAMQQVQRTLDKKGL